MWTLFAEIDATTAGRITGGVLAVVLPLAGAFKCWSISRRPTTNRKCAFALMFLLAGWAVLSMGGLIARLFPPVWILVPLLAVPAFLLILAGFVLAILGLVEYAQQPGVYTQGRAQAIWTLGLSVLLVAIFVGGVIAGARRNFAKRTQPAAGERLRFEDDNFQFQVPPRPWVQPDIAKLNRFAKLGFFRGRPEIYFIIIPEKLPSSFTDEQLAEVALTHMRSVANDVRVLKRAPQQLRNVAGLRMEIESRVANHSLYYVNWLCVTNGWAYQLLGWGRVQDRDEVLREFSAMQARFSLLDYWRTAPRGGTAPQMDRALPNWGFTFRWKQSDWRPFQDLATQVPMATFGAEHLDNAAMTIASVWLMGLEPHDAAVHQAMLDSFGFHLGRDTPLAQREIQQGRFSGIEVQWKRRPDKGEEFNYLARVLRGDGHAHFIVAWVDSKHPGGEKLLQDAFTRLEFAENPQPPPDPAQFDSAENRTHGLALNAIGLTYFEARQYDRAAAFFEAALKHGESPTESSMLVNLVQAWTLSGKHREALEAIGRYPEMVEAQTRLQADRAYLQSELGEIEAALTNYGRLFSGDHRDDAHFKVYAELLANVRHPTNALAAVELYLQKRESPEIRLLQAQLCRRIKDFDRAIALLETQRRKHPFDANVAFGLNEAYLDAARYTDALALSQEMIKNAGDSAYAHYLRGRSQVGLKWYREAKESFEQAAKKAPADPQIKGYLEHVSGLLGEGSNTSLKTAIPPVPIPDALLSDLPPPPAGYARDHGAYYQRRITAISFEKDRELKTTELMEVRMLTPAGVSAFSSFQFSFDPLSEEIFVNRLEVRDAAGQLVSTGRVADYYLLDEGSRQMATQKKIANIPVAGLQPGYSIALTFTHRELGRASEFSFLPHPFVNAFPVRETVLFLRGDTGAVRFAASPGVAPRALPEGLCWQLKEPPVYRWEPLQPSLTEFLPTVWLADTGANWPALVTDYLRNIRDRLELPAAQRDTAQRLADGLTGNTSKIAAIASYLQTNYTYKAIEFGRRARIPPALTDTVRNRYGDCKDHSVLAQQMLAAAGVPAFLALVHSRETVRRELPSLDQFDHMLVYVPGAGQGLFLDCTDKMSALPPDVPLGLAGQDALILDERNPRFARIPDYSATANRIRSARQIDLTNATDALVRETITFSGVHGAYLRTVLREQTPSLRRSTILNYLKPVGTELTELETENLEANASPLVLRLTYTLKRHFHLAGADWVGVLPAFFEQAFLHAETSEKRESPFEITVPLTFESTVALALPPDSRIKTQPESTRQDTRFVGSSMEVSVKTNRLETRFSANVRPGKFGAGEYPEYRAALERTLGPLSANVAWERLKTETR